MYVTQCLHRALQLKPAAVAVRDEGRSLSFRQLAERIARLAAGLHSLGMKAGDRVAMLALNSRRYLEYQLAVWWAGGVLNPCNTRWSIAELAYSLNDSESTLLIVDDAFLPLVGALKREVGSLRAVAHAGDGAPPEGLQGYESLIEEHAPIADACRRASDLAGVFYTGGTTGFPKGVMLSHTNLMSSAYAGAIEGLAPAGGVYLHAAPMFHLADLGIAMVSLVQGDSHAFVDQFRPDRVLATIERERVTHTLLVPTMIHMLVEWLSKATAPVDLSSLHTIVYGAAPMSEALLERATQALPQVRFLQAYGMTELSPIATINPSASYGEAGRALGRHRATGRAAPCAELRVVDGEDRDVARGTVGEVIVRGPNVMLGYWRKPRETEQALRGGWMHTGDAGYLDEDGYLYLVDRLKDMIISGGENVFSTEVESVLGCHPDVAMCAVIGVPDTTWGERVHACIVRRPGAATSETALIKHCHERIAGYKCPRSIEFLDALPVSAAGKILKAELRRRPRTAL